MKVVFILLHHWLIGQYLVRSVQYTHKHHLHISFFTKTTLASQLIYCASPMNPAFRSFVASTLAANLIFSPNFLFFSETYLASLKIDSQWTAIWGLPLRKSATDQTKRSVLYFKVVSITTSCDFNLDPTFRFLSSVSSKLLVSVTGFILQSLPKNRTWMVFVWSPSQKIVCKSIYPLVHTLSSENPCTSLSCGLITSSGIYNFL